MERGRIASELRVCSRDLETCFEDWIGATCLEAWIGGCVERLLGDSCPEIALISCAVVVEGIFCPFSVGCSLFILSVVSLFFYQLFLSPSVSCFFSIGYFSFLVVEGCACFLFTAHF